MKSNAIFARIVMIAVSYSGMVLAEPPQTIDSFLAEHHMDGTTAGLRKALVDPDPAVRGVAAGLLAQQNDRESIPLLRDSLQREQKFGAQVSFASALTKLHDPYGFNWLVAKCNDTKTIPGLRMVAANALLDTGHNDCLLSVMDVLGANSGFDGTSQGLRYLGTVNSIPAPLQAKLRFQLYQKLRNSNAQVKWDAGRTLAVVGDSSSIEHLQRAISSERDKGYRGLLEGNLLTPRARINANVQ